MYFRLLTIIFTLLFAQSSHAKPGAIAIKALEADVLSFKSWLTQHKALNTYQMSVDHQLGSEKHNKRTLESFYLAKSCALKGELIRAKEIFLSLTELALENHWEEPQQEVIYHSFLYLAEIAESPLEKKLWLERAITFLPWYEPDTSSYSIKTKSLLKTTQAKMNSKFFRWSPFEQFAKFETVIVNGKHIAINPGAEVLLSAGLYRITFVAHDLFTQSMVVESQSLNSLNISGEALVNGSCEIPKINFKYDKNVNYIVFFNESCVRKFSGGQWSDYSGSLTEEFLPKYKIAPQGVSGLPLSEGKAKVKTRWKWIGASILAAAVGYAIYDHNRPTEVKKVIVEPED